MSGDPTETERLARLEAQVGGLIEGQEKLSGEVRQILDRLGSTGRTNWALIFAAISVVVAIVLPSIGMLAMFVSFSIQNAVNPLESKAEVSIRDRDELHGSVGRLGERLDRIEAETKASEAKWTEKQTEQESQFRSADQVRNLQIATQMRFVALLWQRTYGDKFPDFLFNPAISQPSH